MNELLQSGVDVYLVGGAVRDSVLGRTAIDHDYVVVGATSELMLSLGFKQVGADFPVFLNDGGEEFALARQERKTSEGYRGFECTFDPTVTIEEDLIRRDFTINSMAIPVLSFDYKGRPELADTIIDPYNGKDDLNNGVIRHTSEAFSEDPLRVLRAARFAARYGFTVAEETTALMSNITNSGELFTISRERVCGEFLKAMNEQFPGEFFIVLQQCGAAAQLGLELPYISRIVLNAMGLQNSPLWEVVVEVFALMHTRQKFENANQSLHLPTFYTDMVDKYFTVKEFRENMLHMVDTETRSNVVKNVFQQTFIADDMVELLHKLGAYKHPDRFANVINFIAKTHGDGWRYVSNMIMVAFNATKHINFSSLSANQQHDLKGRDIGAAIDRLRVEAVHKSCNQHKDKV